MIFKKKQTQEIQIPTRVSRMPDHDLLSWGGTLLMQLGKSFDQFAYSKGKPSEVTDVLEAFNAVWAELSKRNA